jgi:tetratricopeptide (TPR) repeat protein
MKLLISLNNSTDEVYVILGRLHFSTIILLAIGTAATAGASKNDCARLEGDAAILACDRAISENPGDPFLYFYRGVAYKKTGDVERSIVDYNKAITLNPKVAVLYNNRGNAFQEKGDFGHALADYNSAILINPSLDVAYQSRGTFFTSQGDYIRAINDFNQAIRLNPWSAASLNGRCRAFALSNQELQQAEEDCDASLRMAPHTPRFYGSLGYVHLNLGVFDEALKDFEIALASNPSDAESLYGRGLAKRGLGNEAAAIADLALAREIKPDVADSDRHSNSAPKNN